MNISGNLNIQYYINNLYYAWYFTECVSRGTNKSLVQYWLGCMATDINEEYGRKVCSIKGTKFKWNSRK